MTTELAETVSVIDDGDAVFFGGFGYNQPFATAHEVIRQDHEELRVIRASGGILLDQLIGAGVVTEAVISHCWNVIGPTPTHAFRRAVEDDIPTPVTIREHGLGDLVLRLFAGARQLPFIPASQVEGIDQGGSHESPDDTLSVTVDDTDYPALRPLNPDVGIVHAQRADEKGNIYVRGPLAEMQHGAMASKHLIAQVEEIVPVETTRDTPDMTQIPGFMVDSVVEIPRGAHPSGVLGHYGRDINYFDYYGDETQTTGDMENYLQTWVRELTDHDEYLDKLQSAGFIEGHQ